MNAFHLELIDTLAYEIRCSRNGSNQNYSYYGYWCGVMEARGAELRGAVVEHALRLRDSLVMAGNKCWPASAGPLCAVDGEALSLNEVAARLPCGHVFHARCIMPYLRATTLYRRCPIDGELVQNTLAATRLTEVGPMRPMYQYMMPPPTLHRLRRAQLLYTAIADAERVVVPASLSLHNRLLRITERHARAYIAGVRQLPPVPDVNEGTAGACEVPLCNARAALTQACEHDVCTSCARESRCAECGALHAAAPRRWTIAHWRRRGHCRVACFELCLSRLETGGEEWIRNVAKTQYMALARLLNVEHDTAAFEAVEREMSYGAACRIDTRRSSSHVDPLAVLRVLMASTGGGDVAAASAQGAQGEIVVNNDGGGGWETPSPGLSPSSSLSTGLASLAPLLRRRALTPAAAVEREPVPTERAIEAEERVEAVDDSRRICVFDFEPFRSGDVLIRLPCLHVFHRDCVVPYLRRSRHPQCPYDRAPVSHCLINNLPVWTEQ